MINDIRERIASYPEMTNTKISGREELLQIIFRLVQTIYTLHKKIKTPKHDRKMVRATYDYLNILNVTPEAFYWSVLNFSILL